MSVSFQPHRSPKFLQLMISSLHSKDLQIYLNSNTAEHLLQTYHLDASIQSPIGDSLFVVDANIGGDKANSLISNTLDDQVTIDTQGNAIHHTTISYAWKTHGPVYGSPLYKDYVRVYIPPHSILQKQDGWQPTWHKPGLWSRGMGWILYPLVWPNQYYYPYMDGPRCGYKGRQRLALPVSNTAASRLSVDNRSTNDTTNVCRYNQ